MPQLAAYLSYDGNCAEAMQFYAKVLGAKVESYDSADEGRRVFDALADGGSKPCARPASDALRRPAHDLRRLPDHRSGVTTCQSSREPNAHQPTAMSKCSTSSRRPSLSYSAIAASSP
jgi:hypothetical protein